ncbi:hypothetical protein ASF91_21540 [Rhizobium sp. Leaf155]|nr:hypothetical protein ASF91_21540 [Rhizobium sp. Leaf155]
MNIAFWEGRPLICNFHIIEGRLLLIKDERYKFLGIFNGSRGVITYNHTITPTSKQTAVSYHDGARLARLTPTKAAKSHIRSTKSYRDNFDQRVACLPSGRALIQLLIIVRWATMSADDHLSAEANSTRQFLREDRASPADASLRVYREVRPRAPSTVERGSTSCTQQRSPPSGLIYRIENIVRFLPKRLPHLQDYLDDCCLAKRKLDNSARGHKIAFRISLRKERLEICKRCLLNKSA